MRKVLDSLFHSSPSGVCLGLDLGQKRTKVASLTRNGAGFSVVDALDLPTQPGLFAKGRLVDAEEATKYLIRILQQQKVKARKVALTLGLDDAQLKRQEVPRQGREGILRGLRANPALQMVNSGSGNVAVDYHEIGGHESESGTISVLAVVGRKDSVRTLQQVVQEAGLDPDLVSVPAIALVNAWGLSHIDRVAANERSVLIHGGHSGVLIVVLEGEVPVATHFAEVGVDYVNEAARHANPSLSAPMLERALFDESNPTLDPRILDDWFGRIAQEARRLIGAVPRMLGDPGGEKVASVWISGGIARVPGLIGGVGRLLGLEADVFDPLEHLHRPAGFSTQAFGPAMALAIGVAAESLFLNKERSA